MKVWMIFFLLVGMSTGCSKKHAEVGQVYTDLEFNHILDSTGSTPDKEVTRAIRYTDYASGASLEHSKALLYERLSYSALKFSTESEAKKEAIRLNQYYSRNWLFDKVEGEPLLEDMVILKFHAINPNKKIQRKPVHTPLAPPPPAH